MKFIALGPTDFDPEPLGDGCSAPCCPLLYMRGHTEQWASICGEPAPDSSKRTFSRDIGCPLLNIRTCSDLTSDAVALPGR